MKSELVHATAVVSRSAEIHPSVAIGPYAVVEGEVSIGAGCVIGPHAVVRRYTRMGRNNIVDAHAVIGGNPQYTGFGDVESWSSLGDDNVMREGFTINRSIEPGGVTSVGSGCFFMANSHIGHDCRVGNHVTFANAVLLGGHVEVGDGVVFGGAAGAHQFVRVGAYSMIAGFVPLRKDVMPFMLVGGTPIRHFRLNTVGLRRWGIIGDRYRALETAFRALRNGNRTLDGVPDTDEVRFLSEWLAGKSRHGCYGCIGS